MASQDDDHGSEEEVREVTPPKVPGVPRPTKGA